MRKRQAFLMILSIAFLPRTGVCGKFKRVETFPEGEQTSMLIGGMFSGFKDANVVDQELDYPYDSVWTAAKKVSDRFDKAGGRPQTAVDEKNGRVQNGRITQQALIGAGVSAWVDEFVIEATRIADSKTKVSVMRKVVENEMNPTTSQRTWKTQWSNGKIENWLITQIQDELKNPTLPEASPQTAAADIPPGAYVNQKNNKDYIILHDDGTFHQWMGQKQLDGVYLIREKTITWTLPNGVSDTGDKLEDNIITEKSGNKWVRPSTPQSGTAETGATPSKCPATGKPIPLAKIMNPGFVDDFIGCTVTTLGQFVSAGASAMMTKVPSVANKEGKVVFRILPPGTSGEKNQMSGDVQGEHVLIPKGQSDLVFELTAGDRIELSGVVRQVYNSDNWKEYVLDAGTMRRAPTTH